LTHFSVKLYYVCSAGAFHCIKYFGLYKLAVYGSTVLLKLFWKYLNYPCSCFITSILCSHSLAWIVVVLSSNYMYLEWVNFIDTSQEFTHTEIHDFYWVHSIPIKEIIYPNNPCNNYVYHSYTVQLYCQVE